MEVNSCAAMAGKPRVRAAATTAAPSGCSPLLHRRRQGNEGVSSRLPATSTFPSRGLPSVNVPVLSTRTVVTFSNRSMASAFLMRTPAWAPRPTPTMIDMGVARPSAQGQAIMSTPRRH